MNSDVYKMRKFKNFFEHYFCPLSQKENKIFRQPQMVVFFGTRKSNWLSCTNHKMPLNFPFSSWHWLSTQMVQKFSFVSVKAGEREYQIELFIQVECVLCRIFAYKFLQANAMRLCSLLGTFATTFC